MLVLTKQQQQHEKSTHNMESANKDNDNDFNLFADICIDDNSDTESKNKDNDNDFDLFAGTCIDDDADSDDCTSMFAKHSPYPPPPEPSTPIKFIDFEKYVEEKCEKKIKILDRSTFNQIKRPIVIAFNYFREKCAHQTKYLDRIYQLALQYGDRIEFIVADRMDIDVIYPGRNPITFFCNLVDPEKESLHTYVIDEKKRIHTHYDAYQTVETISEVCEQLLNGSLYPSQPIPERNDSLVKVCVHQNYYELVTHSTKDVLLVVGLGEYKKHEDYEPDYESIALQLKDSNVDIVYIDGKNNFIPFHLNANCYPTIIFVPHNDKDNFIHFSTGSRNTKNVLNFIQKNIEPLAEIWRQKELSKSVFKPFSLPLDIELKFEDLEQYLKENFSNYIEMLDRKTFHTMKCCVIIHFMKLKEKGVTFYLETLKTIYQVAEAKYFYGVAFLVADIKDVDIMYPSWYKKYLQDPQELSDSPKVYAIDRHKRAYEVEEFKTASSLFFFYHDLNHSRNFRSQPWKISNTMDDAMKSCVGQNLNILIQMSKKDIFLTIYWPTYRRSHDILKSLNEIADEVQQLKVKLFKMDAKLNYVPLEYSYATYPVHFFIPHRDKENGVVRYISTIQSREDILEFIRGNVRARE